MFFDSLISQHAAARASLHTMASNTATKVCVIVLIRNLVLSGHRIDGSDEDDSYRDATAQTQSVASVCVLLILSGIISMSKLRWQICCGITTMLPL